MATLPTAKWATKKKFLTRELLDEYYTLVLFLYSVTRAVIIVCVYQRVSTNVFQHGTHRRFEQIRMPNFQNYLPILCPLVSDATSSRLNIFN